MVTRKLKPESGRVDDLTTGASTVEAPDDALLPGEDQVDAAIADQEQDPAAPDPDEEIPDEPAPRTERGTQPGENLVSVQAKMVSHAVVVGASNSIRHQVAFEIDSLAAPGFIELAGEVAYGASFAGQHMGSGVTIEAIPTRVDAENAVRAQVKLRIPEYDENGGNQLRSLGPKVVVLVNTVGLLELFEVQPALDLTTRAE